MPPSRARRSINDKRMSVVVPRGSTPMPGPDTVQPGRGRPVPVPKDEVIIVDPKNYPAKVARQGDNKPKRLPTRQTKLTSKIDRYPLTAIKRKK